MIRQQLASLRGKNALVTGAASGHWEGRSRHAGRGRASHEHQRQFFVAAAGEASKLAPPTQRGLPVIDVTAEPVMEEDEQVEWRRRGVKATTRSDPTPRVTAAL